MKHYKLIISILCVILTSCSLGASRIQNKEDACWEQHGISDAERKRWCSVEGVFFACNCIAHPAHVKSKGAKWNFVDLVVLPNKAAGISPEELKEWGATNVWGYLSSDFEGLNSGAWGVYLKELGFTPKSARKWVDVIKISRGKYKHLEELAAFAASGENPELHLKRLNEENKRQQSENNKKQAENLLQLTMEIEKRTKTFRNNINVGDTSHCGLVVEVKETIAKVDTMVGEKWFKINQLYTSTDKSCRFVNGVYQE